MFEGSRSGVFSAAPENLPVVNVGELLWEVQTMKASSVLGNTTSAGLFHREEKSVIQAIRPR